MRRLAHRGGDFVERRGRLFEARRLLLGAPRQIVGRLCDFFGSGTNAAGRAGNRLHRLLQSGDRNVEIFLELLGFGGKLAIDPMRQIALSESPQRGAQCADRESVVLGFPGGIELGQLLIVDIGQRTAGADGAAIGRMAAAACGTKPPVGAVAGLEAIGDVVAGTAALVCEMATKGCKCRCDVVGMQLVRPGLDDIREIGFAGIADQPDKFRRPGPDAARIHCVGIVQDGLPQADA